MKKDFLQYLSALGVNDVRFASLPVRYSPDAYHETIRKVVDRLDREDDVLAIYQIGGIGDPGISDIDLIVVFRDEVSRFEGTYKKNLDDPDTYLFMHGIFGMPLDVFWNRHLLIPIFDLKHIAGQDLEGGSSTIYEAPEKEWIARLYALEYLVVNIFNLCNQFHAKTLKVRPLLCSLKALVHDFRILGYFDREEYVSFAEDLGALRENWWSLDEKTGTGELFGLAIRALELAWNLLATVEEKLAAASGADMPVPMQVGPNGYLDVAGGLLNGISLVTSGTALFFNSLLAILRPLRGTFPYRQVVELLIISYAFRLGLPGNLLETLMGRSSDALCSSVFAKRKNLLDHYYAFMTNRINPEFAIYDTFRWQIFHNRKWSAIRRFNRLIAGRVR